MEIKRGNGGMKSFFGWMMQVDIIIGWVFFHFLHRDNVVCLWVCCFFLCCCRVRVQKGEDQIRGRDSIWYIKRGGGLVVNNEDKEQQRIRQGEERRGI